MYTIFTLCYFRFFSCFCPGVRSTEYIVYEGENHTAGRPLYKLSKGWTLSPRCTVCCVGHYVYQPLRVGCCCCLPYLNIFDSDEKKIGSVAFECTPLHSYVPTFGLYDSAGNPQAALRQDTCCCGQCPSSKSNYYYRDYVTWEKLPRSPADGSKKSMRKIEKLAAFVLKNMILSEYAFVELGVDCCAPNRQVPKGIQEF